VATHHQHVDDHHHVPDGILIQNTQNRDNDILHLKIDELIRATKEAQNASLCLESMSSKELRKLRDQYSSLGKSDQGNLEPSDTDAPHELEVRPHSELSG
jgi:low affinity Fe/Cu permease